MKKKITLEEFWKSEKTICIHCDTLEKANILSKALDKMGKKWINGAFYTEDNKWNCYKEKTIYYNYGLYDNINHAKEKGYTIYEFEEVDLESAGSLHGGKV